MQLAIGMLNNFIGRRLFSVRRRQAQVKNLAHRARPNGDNIIKRLPFHSKREYYDILDPLHGHNSKLIHQIFSPESTGHATSVHHLTYRAHRWIGERHVGRDKNWGDSFSEAGGRPLLRGNKIPVSFRPEKGKGKSRPR